MSPGFHGPVKFSISLIFLTLSGSYIKLFVIDNLCIAQVTSRSYFTRILNLRAWWIDSTYPVLFQFLAYPWSET